MNQQRWRRLNGTPLHHPIYDEVQQTLQQEAALGNTIKVCIGTDSQVKGQQTCFATVIVFVRQGKGAFMYVKQFATFKRMSIKERMLAEVASSIEVAYHLCHLFIASNVAMEVHADINTQPRFKSHQAFKEAMGYINGMGFDFKAKPHAFASSACANKLVQ